MPLLTFVIPVRHQDNSPDWGRLCANLSQTLASIAAQTHDDWEGVIVANEGAELPPLPKQFRVERVTFEKNRIHERGDATKDDFLDAFRIDKGQRVLAGMLGARDSRYFMICDDDDFVSRDIVAHVARNVGTIGWKIDRGYAWTDGGSLFYEHDDFNHICGTSLIIRADIYELPDSMEAADRSWVMEMLGSHHGVDRRLEQRGTPLVPLPFRGAVYRVGHAGSHSQTPGIIQRFVFTPGWARRVRGTARQVLKLRPITATLKRTYFGAAG
jgi:hypothetical protein